MALRSKLAVSVTASQTNSIDLGAGTLPVALSYGVTLTDGTAAGQADRMFTDRRTIAASSNDDLDLAGSLTDGFGATITFARVKAIIISAAAGNTNNVLVGGDATNTFLTYTVVEGDAIILRPGATLALIAGAADATGYAVTAGTGDLLRITNSGAGTSVTYDIVVIGASA
jgi:hypothetical protein